MRCLLTALGVAALLLTAGGASAETLRLKSGGRPVDFALWSPVAQSYSHSDLALSEARHADLEEADIDFLYRLYRSEIHLRADGNVEERETTIRVLRSRAAIHQFGDDYAWVDAHSDKATIEQAYSLLPNGERIEVEPGIIQLTPDDETRVFGDTFQVTVPFSGLVPGAMTVLVVHTLHDGAAFPLPWSRVLRPHTSHPLERFEVEVTWDAGVPAPARRSDMPGLVCREAGARHISCSASALPPFEGDPQMSYNDRLPSLVIAEPVTWAELVQKEAGLFEQALQAHPALDRMAARLTEGAVDAEERLARIHRFVVQDVRYLGLEHGLGGVIPRPTHLTLSRRFGDCKDKTALFVDLARRAGMEAYPVLTSTRRDNLEKLLLPASSYFNHMVACARLPGPQGREICLDLTDPYSSYQVLSRGAQGAIRLDIKPEAEGPQQLPAEDYGWILGVEATHRLTSEGDFESDTTRTFGGFNAAWIRARLQNRSRQEREEWLRENFEEIYSDKLELLSFGTEGADELTPEVRVQTRSLYGDSFDPDDLTDFGDWENALRHEAWQITSDNKNHPYSFQGLRYRGENHYSLPPGHRFAYPGAQVDLASEFGRFTRRYRVEDGKLLVTTELAMPRAVIAAPDVPRFNRFVDHVRDNALITFDVAKN